MKTSFLLPTAILKDNEDLKYITDLLFVEYNDLSSRERQKVDSAMDHGELYHGEHVILEDGNQVFRTDLGDPSSCVEIRVPSYVPKEKAVWMLSELVDKLMEI